MYNVFFLASQDVTTIFVFVSRMYNIPMKMFFCHVEK